MAHLTFLPAAPSGVLAWAGDGQHCQVIRQFKKSLRLRDFPRHNPSSALRNELSYLAASAFRQRTIGNDFVTFACRLEFPRRPERKLRRTAIV
jgi:hypothetical protein